MSALMGPGGPQQVPIEPQQAPQEDEQKLSRPQEIAQQVIEAAPPEMRSKIGRMREMGKSIMFSPNTHELVLKAYREMPAGNESDRFSKSIAALISMIKEKSQGPFPLDAAIPAATVLLMDLMDFVGESGEMEITDELIADATQELTGYMMQKMNIGPEEIRAAQQSAQGGSPQPTAAPQAPAGPQPLMRGPQ